MVVQGQNNVEHVLLLSSLLGIKNTGMNTTDTTSALLEVTIYLRARYLTSISVMCSTYNGER